MTEDYQTNNEDLNSDPLYSLSSENNRLEEENNNLKRTVEFYQRELEKFRNPPFIVSEVISVTDEYKAIIKLPNQSNFLVDISQNCQNKINTGDMVLNEQKSLVIMNKINLTKNFPVENYLIINKDIKVNWEDIGGLEKEKEKVKDVLELPLTKPGMFKKIGITPPKGVLLHGPPGTGKTMIAKALAKETNATFIELVGSELVQKFIGEGAKLVKELFELAQKKSPTIIFIDEIDSIAAKRIETGTSGEREVHRTFMQLLGEIDGFNALDNVKIIAATNRIDILDEAVMRPGRLEKHVEIKSPNKKGRLEILKIHTKKMLLEQDVNLEELSELTKNYSGADLQALVTEAGYLAIKSKKESVSQQNFKKAIKNLKTKEEYNMLNSSFN